MPTTLPDTRPAAPHAATDELPTVVTDLSPEQVLERLDVASRRGRLPGFERAGGGGLFSAAAFGQPFDKVLVASAERAEAGPTILRFRLRLPPKMPLIYAAVLAATIWPGVHLMDSLIPGEWGWIPTWWWYLPLTILPIPWAWRAAMRKTHASARASALRQIEQVAQETGGRVGAAAE